MSRRLKIVVRGLALVLLAAAWSAGCDHSGKNTPPACGELVAEWGGGPLPGYTPLSVAEIQAIVDRLAKGDGGFKATVKTLLAREPFEVAPEAAIVRSLADTATRVLGKRPRFYGDTPWMDSALLAAAGVETVVMGPAGAGAHAAEEWVDVESVFKAAEILAETALHYCGKA